MDLRKIDALVAEHVMGLKKGRKKQGYSMFEYHYEVKEYDVWIDEEGNSHHPRRYSSDISAAWEVVEKLRYISIMPWKEGKWNATAKHEEFTFVQSIQDTAPLAICLAALKAKGVEVD